MCVSLLTLQGKIVEPLRAAQMAQSRTQGLYRALWDFQMSTPNHLLLHTGIKSLKILQ